MLRRIIIIGGRLQGSEVAYLGREAGFEVILIDKDPEAPGRSLCHRFICEDITDPGSRLIDIMKTAEMILPTLENYETLEHIVELCESNDLNLAFDWNAYKISCSKIRSDELFREHGLASPRYYPGGNYPYIAKPSGESGSHGVTFLRSDSELREFAEENRSGYIIQEYVSGPSYSVEVIGSPGSYRTYGLTEIFVDGGYDCNAVCSLRNIDPDIRDRIRAYAVGISDIIRLRGIMDLEVIVQDGQVKILEIDARFPSQTPIVVYHATGMNYVEELFDLFTEGDFLHEQHDTGRHASLTHYLVENGRYSSPGEHIMTEGDVLDYTDGISEEAVVISDHAPGKSVWRGTFICHASTEGALRAKNERISMKLSELAAGRHTGGESTGGEYTGGEHHDCVASAGQKQNPKPAGEYPFGNRETVT